MTSGAYSSPMASQSRPLVAGSTYRSRMPSHTPSNRAMRKSSGIDSASSVTGSRDASGSTQSSAAAGAGGWADGTAEGVGLVVASWAAIGSVAKMTNTIVARASATARRGVSGLIVPPRGRWLVPPPTMLPRVRQAVREQSSHASGRRPSRPRPGRRSATWGPQQAHAAVGRSSRRSAVLVAQAEGDAVGRLKHPPRARLRSLGGGDPQQVGPPGRSHHGLPALVGTGPCSE